MRRPCYRALRLHAQVVNAGDVLARAGEAANTLFAVAEGEVAMEVTRMQVRGSDGSHVRRLSIYGSSVEPGGRPPLPRLQNARAGASAVNPLHAQWFKALSRHSLRPSCKQ